MRRAKHMFPSAPELRTSVYVRLTPCFADLRPLDFSTRCFKNAMTMDNASSAPRTTHRNVSLRAHRTVLGPRLGSAGTVPKTAPGFPGSGGPFLRPAKHLWTVPVILRHRPRFGPRLGPRHGLRRGLRRGLCASHCSSHRARTAPRTVSRTAPGVRPLKLRLGLCLGLWSMPTDPLSWL